MKKGIVFSLLLAATLALTACGKGGDSKTTGQEKTSGTEEKGDKKGESWLFTQ